MANEKLERLEHLESTEERAEEMAEEDPAEKPIEEPTEQPRERTTSRPVIPTLSQQQPLLNPQQQKRPSPPQTPSAFHLGEEVYYKIYPYYNRTTCLLQDHHILSQRSTITSTHYIPTSFGALWEYQLAGEPWRWFAEKELVDRRGNDWLTRRVWLTSGRSRETK
jgi:hypothetical protein